MPTLSISSSHRSFLDDGSPDVYGMFCHKLNFTMILISCISTIICFTGYVMDDSSMARNCSFIITSRLPKAPVKHSTYGITDFAKPQGVHEVADKVRLAWK